MILKISMKNGTLSRPFHDSYDVQRQFRTFHDLFLSSRILKCVRSRIQGNVCAVQTRMCGIGELSFNDHCAGVRLHEGGSCAGKVEGIESYTDELMVTVLVAWPSMAALVIGAQEQR